MGFNSGFKGLNSAAIVIKDGEIITHSIKIIKTIYKFHYKITVVAEPPEIAHGILGFHETHLEELEERY